MMFCPTLPAGLTMPLDALRQRIYELTRPKLEFGSWDNRERQLSELLANIPSDERKVWRNVGYCDSSLFAGVNGLLFDTNRTSFDAMRTAIGEPVWLWPDAPFSVREVFPDQTPIHTRELIELIRDEWTSPEGQHELQQVYTSTVSGLGWNYVLPGVCTQELVETLLRLGNSPVPTADGVAPAAVTSIKERLEALHELALIAGGSAMQVNWEPDLVLLMIDARNASLSSRIRENSVFAAHCVQIVQHRSSVRWIAVGADN